MFPIMVHYAAKDDITRMCFFFFKENATDS